MFAARDIAEPYRRAVGHARAHLAHGLAHAILRLDHDDAGAVIGHRHGQMRTRQELRKVQNL